MKFLVIKSRAIKTCVLVVLVLCLLAISINGKSASSVYFGSSLREIPIYSVQTEQKKVAISFDAAWGSDKTEKIIELLKEFNCDATFFLVGFWVENYPDKAKLIADAGFEIGTHSNTHPDMTKLDKSAMDLEFKKSINSIQNATQITPKLFRAPFGAYNDTLINVAKQNGLATIQWDVDSLDWKGGSGTEIATRILSKVKNGSIILCHNNSDHILDALPILLPSLIAKGYKICSVGDLILKDNYYIDHEGTQRIK